MGLLDLPAPIFTWLDGYLEFLPSGVRLALWGAVSGVLSMQLYAVLSPQQRIAAGKAEQRQARERLDAFDGELNEAWPLIRNLLGSSLRQVGRIFGPAVLASLPVLCVMVWMSTAYGYRFPDHETPIQVVPPALEARWIGSDPSAHDIEVLDPERGPVARVRLAVPVPVVEKRHWWNTLVGNPAGYLPAEGPIRRIEPELPRLQHLPLGPSWMRGWELTFLLFTILASLLQKYLRGIE